MLEKSKLKKKSKCLKKPLELKNTISQTLAHNNQLDSIFKKESASKPQPSKPRPNAQQRDIKLQSIYNQVELQHRTDSDSDNSEEMFLADLEKKEEGESSRKCKRNKKSMLFSHLFKDSGNLTRKLSVLEEKINHNIEKYSVESKIKEMSGKQTPTHQRNCSLLPRNLEKNVAKLSDEGATEIRLPNMQLAHYSLGRVKEQLSSSGKLRVLDLSYNSLTNKSIPLLVDILTQNVIEELSVKWNQLTYEGGMELIEAVTYNVNLASLDLSYNKLTNTSPTFTDACIRLLTQNRYLAHLNLEMCHLNEDQCSILARTFNLVNETIVSLHFKGNGRYYVNKLGYITKHATRQDMSYISPSRDLTRHSQHEPLHNLCSRYVMGEDCCWLCQRWVGESFKFPREVPPVSLNSQSKDDYFIHMSCYDYQPIKLTIEECVNTIQGKKECKRLEWANYEVHLAHVPVPSNKDLTYFFTSNGKALINEEQPTIDTNQIVCFEVFDVFEELYSVTRVREQYSVTVRKMNTRSKDDFNYNKLKKLKGDISQYSYKEAFRNENKRVLKAIASKGKKMSMLSAQCFESLPKISKSKPVSPRRSKVASTAEISNEDMVVSVNIRKCKQKPLPPPQAEKYVSLGISPRNREFLFNYQYFQKSGMEIEEVSVHQQDFERVESECFGAFRVSYITKFLKQRHNFARQQQFMDRFKILTRKYFNSHELLFSDIFSFLFSNFISKNGCNSKQAKHADRGKNNKSVKFVQTVNNQTKVSIVIHSEKNVEKHVEGKTTVQMSSSGQQRAVQRKALSMNCISDKYQLSKLRAMPAGSIPTLHSNPPSTDKSIKSINDIPQDVTPSLLQLSLEGLPRPIDLTDEVYARYSMLAASYGREKRMILELINGYERNSEKEKLKELNQIILTFNYYRLTQHYEQTIQKGIERLLANLTSFRSLSTFLPTDNIKNLDLPVNQEGQLDLEALQQQVGSQSIYESFLSFSEFLSNQEHPIRLIKRGETIIVKPSKKRKGKYGRSQKNIKEELMGQQSKVVLPADSDKLLQQIEQEELNQVYNDLVRHLNIITDILLQMLDQLVNKYLNSHNCGDEKALIDQWLKAQLTARLAYFISQLLQNSRTFRQMGKVRDRCAEICQHFVLNSLVQLVRASVMLSSSVLQQNLKEYQFISPFHSYEFIIGLEITKLTHITRSLNDPQTIKAHLVDLLSLLSDIWTRYQLELIQTQKARKQEEEARRKKRFKTINDLIEQAIASGSPQ